MTPELAEVFRRVQEQIAEQIEALEQLGPAYTREFIESTMKPKTVLCRARPQGLHPLVAKMVRDVTMDEMVEVRRRGDFATPPTRAGARRR